MWRDLSDDELRVRLERRGVPLRAARDLVAGRDELGGLIDRLLFYGEAP